jgi:hypothetical protein
VSGVRTGIIRGLTLSLCFLLCGCVSGTAEGPDPILTDPVALHGWLNNGGYASWHAESAVYPGEFGAGGSRVFINDTLRVSLTLGYERHPAGSVAVRELYESDLVTSRGYSVLIKTADRGDAGSAWYFYETFDMQDALRFSMSSYRAPGCVKCHQEGIDYIRSEVPLR